MVDGDAGEHERERLQAHAPPGSGKAPAAGGMDDEHAASGSKPSAPLWDSPLEEPLLTEHIQEGHTDLETACNATPSAHAPAPAGPPPVAIGVPIAAEPPRQHQLPRRVVHVPTWRQQALVLLGTTFFLTTLFMCQVFSLLFTTVSRASLPAILPDLPEGSRRLHMG